MIALLSAIPAALALAFLIRVIIVGERNRILRHDLKSLGTNRDYWRTQYDNLQLRFDNHLKWCRDIQRGGLYVDDPLPTPSELSRETEA